MRRVVLSTLALLLAAILLIGLKSPIVASATGLAALAPDTAGNAGLAGAADPAGPIPDSGSATPAGSPTRAPGGRPPANPTAGPTRTTSAPGQPQPQPSSTRTTTAPATRTITGDAVSAIWHGANYGKMQVRITVTGTHIDDIVAIQQSNRPKSVATTLRQQALTAQSANVGVVSGATASSVAYKQSLDSAIARM
jgi:uncharacterized protein with FMN-binding domain